MEKKLEYVMEHKGFSVINTDHANRQAKQRHGMTVNQMKDFFTIVIDFIKAGNFEIMEYNQEVFFYSTKYQRGMILAFRRDFKENAEGMCIVCVTVYPYGQSRPMKDDTEAIYV